jgi:hypothetical protein
LAWKWGLGRFFWEVLGRPSWKQRIANLELSIAAHPD